MAIFIRVPLLIRSCHGSLIEAQGTINRIAMYLRDKIEYVSARVEEA